MIPNYLSKVEECKALYPEAWKHAHVEGDPKAWDFIRLLAAYINEGDGMCGLNGKRLSLTDLSMDALNYTDEDGGPGRDQFGRRCWVVDVIQGAGSPSAKPVWNPFTDPVASTGAWIKPGTVQEPPHPPQPAIITRDEFYARFQEVNAYYAAEEGLKRPGGMVIDSANPVRADHEAMGKWGYDLMLGKSVEDCKKEIRQSGEWKTKHPGETP